MAVALERMARRLELDCYTEFVSSGAVDDLDEPRGDPVGAAVTLFLVDNSVIQRLRKPQVDAAWRQLRGAAD